MQAPLAERAAAAGKHLLLEKPIALDVAGADRVVDAVARGRRRLGRVLHRSGSSRRRRPGCEQAARTKLAGGHASWLASLAGSPFDASPWRKEHGALWDIGPHALSVLVPALGPVVLGAGRRAGPATPCTWCSAHASGVALRR